MMSLSGIITMHADADADGEKVMHIKVNMHTDAPTIKALHNIRCIFHHSS